MADLFESSGILRYTHKEGYGYRLVLEVDQSIVNYYRKLIPKYIQSSPQMYAAHISVVRKEVPVNLDFWGKYEGDEIPFQYSPIIHFGLVYCWLNCYSVHLEALRVELGLPVSSKYTLPPEGFTRCWHMTIGNFK